jgi:RHS repeat-associated protein
MGYSLQDDIGVSDAPSKTHTRVPRSSSPGLRFYSPSLGRWLSRDPIGELGGVNPYAACGNDSVDKRDALGLLYGGSPPIVSLPPGVSPTASLRADPSTPGGWIIDLPWPFPDIRIPPPSSLPPGSRNIPSEYALGVASTLGRLSWRETICALGVGGGAGYYFSSTGEEAGGWRYAHCYVSCKIKKCCGREASIAFGYLKELRDWMTCHNDHAATGQWTSPHCLSAFQPTDFADNEFGRSCASGTSCGNHCAGYFGASEALPGPYWRAVTDPGQPTEVAPYPPYPGF